LIDFYTNNQMPITHYVQQLQGKPYIYGIDHLPHDGASKELGTGRSIEEIMRSVGRTVKIVPKLSIVDGINAARTIFNRCYFDEQKCAEGIQSLRHYRYDVDKDTKELSVRPLHDYHSHAADAFRYFAVAIEEDRPVSSARGIKISGWRS
jgi:phage terminase large subunit